MATMSRMLTALGLVTLLAFPPGAAPTPAAAPAQREWDLRWMAESPWDDAVPRPPASNERLRKLGASLYLTRCASCHGENGDGKGPVAARLSVPPTNFLLGVYKLRSTPTGSIPTREDLFRTVTRGIHGTPMLPWKQLRTDERWALVYHLQGFSVRFKYETPAATILVPRPPRETDVLRERGEDLYGRLRCAQCHGEQGAGNGPAADVYRHTTGGRAVRIRDFTRGRFIRGAEMSDIYLTLRTGVEGTPMGSYDGLPDQDIWALASYVRSLVREHRLWELPPARTVTALDRTARK
jgi:cytochrome c oxidase cbb3-type subunit 2